MILKVIIFGIKMKFIIVGRARSGKSTIANYLSDKYHIPSFALGDSLKQLTFKLLSVFNISINSVHDLHDDNTKEKYRAYLQQIGTECCRSVFGENIWCETLDKEISQLNNWIISDVRFLNEYNYFTQKYPDAITIKVVRDFSIAASHQSELETKQIKTKYFIENNNTFDMLYENIDNIVIYHKIIS